MGSIASSSSSKSLKLSQLPDLYVELLKDPTKISAVEQKIKLLLQNLKENGFGLFDKMFESEKYFTTKLNKLIMPILECACREKTVKTDRMPVTKEALEQGGDEFKKDYCRTNRKGYVGSICIQDNILKYELIKSNALEKTYLTALDKKLNDSLEKQSIDKKDIESFKNFIYYQFSQYSIQKHIATPILLELDKTFESSGYMSVFRIPDKNSLKRNDFIETIKIIDPKTIRIEIRSEDPEHEFLLEEFPAVFREENEEDIHGIKIKNIRSKFEYNLAEDGTWKASEERNKILFIISDLY
ncbi:MAG: hypothetical protein K1060chlam4_00121 [Candidatus Anoxychlamydiales bacterium]|nr:hypothetical protein [Candidatus Anoxychlamydiales bacterium]